MSRPQLSAAAREVHGKAVKNLRRQGIVPAVVFGHGYASNAIQLDGHEFELLRRRTGRNTLLDLSLAPGGLTPELIATLDSAGPFGVGWPGPRVAVGPVHLIKADVVGTDHVRLIAGGQDGASFKAIAFRTAQTELGQSLLHGAKGRRLWLAGRAKIDDWGSRPQAELHLEDAAWAD